MPGSFLPSTYSRLAPPPVLTWLNFLSSLSFSIIETVSPPPTTLNAFFGMAFAIVVVPLSNGFCSHRPSGPFQKRVFAVVSISA